MEGHSEDPGAPDSWESADLEEGVKRLLVSTPSSRRSPPEFSDDEPQVGPPQAAGVADASTSSSSSSAAAASDRNSAFLEAVAQVDPFLREALQNPRERLSILRMEQDVEKFIHDPRQQQLEFQQLPTSYLRLAAHRIAQHYYLQSMVVLDNNLADSSGSKIVLRKIPGSRLPLVRLADIPVNLPQDDNSKVVKVAIKQRPQKLVQSFSNTSHHSSKANYLRSVEERKEEYNKARARIFSHNNSSSFGAKSESDQAVSESSQHSPSLTRVEEKTLFEGSEINSGKGLGESSLGGARSNRNRSDKEIVGRSKPNSRVAIFRDRDLDRKDPDYDRSYDRYMQRFDPGFGFTSGPYTIQPMYSPAINYNTEFPQLGAASLRPQIPMEHAPRAVTQHPRGPWAATGSTTAINYAPHDGMMTPFNPPHVGGHSSSAIYLQSSQYACPRPGLPFLNQHESVHQPFPQQPHQQQSEASFGLGRPR
ncbi:uncharacterized protein LOC116264661 isoform X1 [Nymphaea colorata]|nr:uncharacterized protein LOC116264661 isoform X1 [Nymphaea colorata]XP_031500860.1 uncharacterized protein LOC116264661 isoform X1 [Nymphaea colorata]XP_049936589.1 uncharacterized protein LOC116264661 isoform X1 [Nymphaea colorata]